MKLNTAYNLVDERPLKDIVLNHDELLHHAFEISNFHAQAGTGRKRLSLIPRVKENARFLQKAHREVNAYVQTTKDMVPAVEWFLDNYYLLKDLSQDIQSNLPSRYDRQLPRLAGGVFQGYPRVYALMVELIEHTDSQLDGDSLRDFINTYQEQVPLSSGELWATPIMLKVALLENVRRLTEQILDIQHEREAAEKWLAPFRYAEHSAQEWDEVLEKAEEPASFSPAFGERLLKRVREMGLDGLPLLHWLDRAVARHDTTVENLAKLAHQQQAAFQVSMGHAIGSLRFLSAEDWPRFFEAISLVERVLQIDPSEVYAAMDFESRDAYRHEVEKLAHRFAIPETLVARKVLAESQKVQNMPGKHVGFYLLGLGRESLEKEFEKEWGPVRNTWCELRRFVKHHPGGFYFGGMGVTLVCLYFLILQAVRSQGILSPRLDLIFLLAFFPLSSSAMMLVNFLAARIVPPTFLPKLELGGGVPAHLRTMVVIPTLLPSVARVQELLQQLEVYYLANQDPNLHFTLLGDFTDAQSESMPGDEAILAAASRGIERLNQKYGSGQFFFFHRHRLWNPKEGAWLGWERKRGKLIEFNRLLSRSGLTSYSTQVGDLSLLPTVKYVITLDADTQLIRGTARKLVGALAHPLQAARLSEDGKRVESGYGLLQPRIGVSVSGARASFFARIFSGKVGIDPYTAAISDVYQDLFGEGIFTGKGIYDVNIFHHLTGEQFPENTILSHDLIEGIYARTGLVTDIELIDGYPGKYHAHMRRLHRWVRGDWQIARWLFEPLPPLSKWKIFDNLRRSLTAPAEILQMALAFALLPGEPWLWAGIVLTELFLPVVLCAAGFAFNPKAKSDDLGQELHQGMIQILIQLIFLPYLAYTMLDAIGRSLYRQWVSHKHLLEWETAAAAERRLAVNMKTSWTEMWPALSVVLGITGWVGVSQPGHLISFLPFVLLWFSSPWVAYRISLPLRSEMSSLGAEERLELRGWARRIWAFFEEYVGPEDNWLPPDNIQIYPPNGVAHRTSPTNIALALLANLAARDLGYITLETLQQRVENTLTSIEGLERWNGHLYNWYDTVQKRPLLPLYVSTVDSGNLILYLLTLKQGLEEALDSPILDHKLLYGLRDTYELLAQAEAKEKNKAGDGEENDAPDDRGGDAIEGKYAAFGGALFACIAEADAGRPTGFQDWLGLIELGLNAGISIQGQKDGRIRNTESKEGTEDTEQAELGECAEHAGHAEDSEREEVLYWEERLRAQVMSLHQEMQAFYPWLGQSWDALEEERLQDILPTFSLRELKAQYTKLQVDGLSRLKEEVAAGLQAIQAFLTRAQHQHRRLQALAMVMDFRPLYDADRQLFSIGYRIHDGALDKSYYDLLASEARQASFIAIAKGDVPQSHWFRLGRSLTEVKGRRGLVSWSGTMFEFLMPLLVMRNYEGTLLDETYRAIVEVQRLYGEEHHMPWGISESGFYAFDAQLNYQYKAFGVPGLGLKRGLIQDRVIAPYATFLSLMVEPKASAANVRQMAKMGFAGRYGLYEAVDYTPERLPTGENYRIVKSFMAHHQGMSFLALTNVLEENSLQKRFHANTLVQSAELLLQERIPAQVQVVPQPEERVILYETRHAPGAEDKRAITVTSAETSMPVAHFVSNGEYSVMLTNSGSGYSRFKDIAVTRWREDVTRDHWGMYFYIQNLNSGNAWSATHQPWGESGQDFKVSFAPDKVEFNRKDGNLATRTEIVVSPEDPVEIRRLSLSNQSKHERTLEITSYFEVVLARPNDDLAHPAFSNLFIQTEFEHQSLLASRRPRREDQERLWLMHTVALEGEGVGSLQYETDRARFIGRGRTLSRPQALEPNQPLSNSVGQVIDPIMSLRQRVLVRPGQTVKVSFSVGVAASREEAIRLAEKYRNPAAVSRAHELAWSHSQMELRYLNLTPSEANEALSLAAHLVYTSPCRRDFQEILTENSKGQSGLWAYAISGDLPLVLLRVQEFSDLDFVREFLRVHEYWSLKGLKADLVILNEDESGYVQSFQDTLRDLIAIGHGRELMNQSGGVFLLQRKHLPPEDIALLFTVARAVFSSNAGSCSVQLRKKAKTFFIEVPTRAKELEAQQTPKGDKEGSGSLAGGQNLQTGLLYANGYGGFDAEMREYVIELSPGSRTPLPWLNVIANPRFGFQVSESGAGYTWSLNSRENKLTPWSNDPIQDPPGEVFYLRDEVSGEYWTPTASPIRDGGRYQIRHGQGYSYFNHVSQELDQEMLLFVPLEDPLKVVQVRLKNLRPAKRTLTATYYAEMVLGVAREQSSPYLVSEFDAESQSLFMRNTYQEEFTGRRAFLAGQGGTVSSYTGDRSEFIGRNGNLREPLGLIQDELSQAVGAGLDPCAALQLKFTLGPGEEKNIFFFFGEAESREAAQTLIAHYRDPSRTEHAFKVIQRFWQELTGRLQVETPEPSLNLLMNSWLLYQTVVCRLWARSAFYQSGGAYGFRDQLQDVMALSVAAPDWIRDQIIKHCAHQFKEGDVQHWWHAEKGKGIRTKFSDDFLWLPFVTADYLEHTGDDSVLEERVPFLEDTPLAVEEDERYFIPQVSADKGSVYEHCIRAIEHGLRFGEHGLPLIGSGDWNDGFSRIGRLGKGESVWLGWFLYKTLQRFAPIAETRLDEERAKRYRLIAHQLQESLERDGWDGGWYRRAYFDDGTPLGSARNQECQIDAIAQSWAVISGAARESRAEDAMLALEHYLWRREEGILVLLTPPFDKAAMDPGYIKGYVPGVRENGGQYTHGAIWAVLAFSLMGEGDKAYELFQMLNPINHARTESEVSRYKTEPYVMAADVYAVHPHAGRGGWSWYTGAAGWMYQAGLEGILGFNIEGAVLRLNPCIPRHWSGYKLKYLFKHTIYQITVENPDRNSQGIRELWLDGVHVAGDRLGLVDDRREHRVRVKL